ncbi:hypothetical protein M5689_000604 [Euphorbia peplus]|nr:hypothetical protein M5689_000604 [Euphorbia peplus]
MADVVLEFPAAESTAEAVEDIWDRYRYDFGTNYSGLFKALLHVYYNVCLADVEALAAASFILYR